MKFSKEKARLSKSEYDELYEEVAYLEENNKLDENYYSKREQLQKLARRKLMV